MLAVLVLLAIATLVACSSSYSASSDGLVIVPNFGSAVVQAFSFSLTNGKVSRVNTAPPIPGKPVSMVLDPAGTFAYVAIQQGSGIATYSINSDGTLSAVGSPTTLNATNVSTQYCPTQPVPAIPSTLAIDSAGKFLFASDGLTGAVSVFGVSSGTLSEVPGSPFCVPTLVNGTNANLVGLAVTPTKYPVLNTQSVQNAVCSLGQPLPPSTPEYLYVADANNNVVWAFTVQSNGVLALITNNGLLSFAADSVTTGVAVDPCNRFVFVTNNTSNNISAYAICNTTSPARPPICDTNQYPEGFLVQVAGSPFGLGGGTPNGPTVPAVDPLANFLYVLDYEANQISCFRITQVNGGLAPLSPATVATGSHPVAIAIRGDDNWLFVANNDALSGGFGIVSQYEITPASGVLTQFGTGIQTDNYPMAVAVK